MKTVAVIGASSNRGKFGNKALRAFARQGYRVYPDQSKRSRGRRSPHVRVRARCSGTIDMATLYVPADVGVSVMDDVAKKGIPGGLAESRRR